MDDIMLDIGSGKMSKVAETILMGVSSSNLQVLLDNKINVRLDSRLHEEKYGFWDTEAQSIYYPEERMLCLWDRADEKKGFWRQEAQDYGSSMVNKFCDSYAKKTDAIVEPLVGYTYTIPLTISTGKSTTVIMQRHYAYEAASKRWSEKHPDLLKPNF